MRFPATPARLFAAISISLLFSACTLVSPYDATFDQELNKLSEDTAKFIAAAEAGGNERLATSKEAVSYYAVTYNILDRLSQRASATRASVPCPANPLLQTFSEEASSRSPLPDDYSKFDCREVDLYAVRLHVDQLKYAQEKDGTLNKGEVKLLGGELQRSILGAIHTFMINKSEEGA